MTCSFQEYLTGKSSVDRILHFHYLICMLLPVLKHISEDQNIELETEAKVKGVIFVIPMLIISEAAICLL